MRITRRGCYAAQGGGAKYVWAVYNLAYGIDESAGGTDGSVSLSSSRYKMAAKGYTISDSGTVTLTDPAQTTAANLAVGDYLVNVSTSNSTATTGDTLYKVTGVSGSWNYTITYTAYTPALNARGTDTGQRVESNTADDYPVDGIQGDYYYVMVRGYGTVYIWDVYNYTPGWNTVTSTPSSDNPPRGISKTSSTGYDVSATIGYDQTGITGKPDITSGKAVFPNNSSFDTVAEFLKEYNSYNNVYYGVPNSDHFYDRYSTTSSSGGTVNRITAYRRLDIVYGKKGAATGEQVQSLTSTAYPSDGVQGDYWYTYNSSYTGWFDFT